MTKPRDLATLGGGFTQSGTGAIQRTVENKLKDTVSVKDFGAVGDGTTDDTAAIQAALNAKATVYFPIPASAYLVSSINIPAGRNLQTENIAVKFQQKTGQTAGTRVFTVMGSNVAIGDMTIQGNIATDTDEFNHAIGVASSWSGVSLSNITIGNIKAVNIRGDGIYIGQTVANGTVSNVRLASAEGNNVLRNVVSIVGGSDIEIGQVSGSAVGYMHVDVEPDGTYTGNCYNVRVGQVKGRHIGMVVNNPSGSLVFNENIRFDEVNLDPAFATQSTPAYSPGASIASRAVILRSLRSGFIGSLKINGFNSQAIWAEAGGIGVESLVIDQCTLTDCAKTDTTYYSYIQCPNITFKYLRAVTQASAASQRIIQESNCIVLSGNFILGNNSSVVRSGANCVLQNCVISGSGATSTYVAIDANNLKISGCTITNVERLAGFMNNLEVENTTATLSAAVLNTVSKVVYIKSTIQSQYYPFGIVDRTYTESIAIGGYFLWVDSSGSLRINSGAPASDTSGTVVGTQT
jgi:hypothetical protein